jgi:hypothetical protein
MNFCSNILLIKKTTPKIKVTPQQQGYINDEKTPHEHYPHVVNCSQLCNKKHTRHLFFHRGMCPADQGIPVIWTENINWCLVG